MDIVVDAVQRAEEPFLDGTLYWFEDRAQDVPPDLARRCVCKLTFWRGKDVAADGHIMVGRDTANRVGLVAIRNRATAPGRLRRISFTPASTEFEDARRELMRRLKELVREAGLVDPHSDPHIP